MATLVFDIETCALSLDHFDEAQQEYLFRDARAQTDEAAARAKQEAAEQMMSLWPLTAQVLCIAMVNADTGRGKVLFVAEDHEESPSDAAVEFVPCVDEGELLGAFWDAAKHYDQIVTFNGRGFDVPFLYLRSAQLGVPISRKNWLGYRFATEPHCDLAEQLTFYGVSGRDGAARRFNLDFYCKAFGIESPKSAGVSGHDVRRLRDEGRHREIGEYCLRDVQATLDLFRLWKERLSGIK
jgi:DNA polymerase elongation subunit (family B)